MTEIKSKRFETYLIINWKNNSMRLIKKKPTRELGPFELPIHVDLKIILPKFQEVSVKGEVEIPQTRVEGIVIESI